MSFTIRSITRRLFFCIAMLCFVGAPGQSNAAGFYYHIKDEISNEQFADMKYLLDIYEGKIKIGDLRIIKHDYFSIIRIVKEEFCEQDFCINIVVRNCADRRCQSTTVIASDKFTVGRIPRDDLGLLLQFPTRIDGNYTSVIINSRFVAALQGL